MARKLYYKVVNDGLNVIRDEEWEEILRLQHWYNSEFVWTSGRLAMKMYAIFPNQEYKKENLHEDLQIIIQNRYDELKREQVAEREIVRRLEEEGLIIVKQGGYIDDCVASGFTRVASNEFNAYLVSEFLLKASLIVRTASITVYDEGEFIKSQTAVFRQGSVVIPQREDLRAAIFRRMVANRHVFSVVDAYKYDHHPKFESTIADFNKLPKNERNMILHDWNWLGFENNFDINGDDIMGFDLNKKVVEFRIEPWK